MALRKRLNETVDELEILKKEHLGLEVEFDAVNRELTIAKSDRELWVTLVVRFHSYYPSSSHSCE